MRRTTALLIDVCVVVIFVLIGRSAHDEANAVIAIAATAAPFLIALGLGWVAVVLTGLDPREWRGGLVIWLITWAIGLALRAVVFDEGTAGAFMVVAGVFLAAGLVGWRVLRAVVSRPGARPDVTAD